jgi:hypothetical protein
MSRRLLPALLVLGALLSDADGSHGFALALLLFSILFGVWGVNRIAFNGEVVRELATQFLALAEKQRTTVPLMVGHRVMGISLLLTGGIVEGRGHLDQALALYDPAEHHPLATRFGADTGVSIVLSFDSPGCLAIPTLRWQNERCCHECARDRPSP